MNGVVVKHRLHQEFVEYAKQAGQPRRSTETELGIGLNKVVPGLKSRTQQFGNMRYGVWDFPDLDTCRRAFDGATNFPHGWNE